MAMLNDYAKNHASQHGEDGILEKIFSVIKTDNWCVEFGAWDGKHLSNTWHLIEHKHWSAILIEADKSKFKELAHRYSNNKKVFALNLFIEFSGKNCLDNVLKRTPIPRNFDLLSIDIDGDDYHVWQTLRHYDPKVVVIEYNPSFPNDVEYIPPKDMTLHHGSSLLALKNLGKKKGYELVCVTDTNAIFVKKVYYPLFSIEDNELDTLHKDRKYQTRLFQLYDGTLIIDGCDRLIWDDIKIRQGRIQELPRFLRDFGNRPKSYVKTLLARIGVFKAARKNK